LRELEERAEDFLAPLTVPDFFVEDVRLDAAAARLVGAFPELRALEAELFAEPLAALRLEERAADFEPERALDERAADDFALEREAVFEAPRAAVDDFLAADLVDFAEDFAVVFLAVVLRAAVFLAVAFLAVEDFAADFLAVDFLAEDFAVAFLAAVLAEDFVAVRAEDFVADLVDRAVDFAAVFVPAFFEAVLFEPDFAVLFGALLRAVEPLLFLAAPLFLAPDLELEPRRALLFFDLVLVAPVSPVNSIVSGFDLSSVGIAASFKGLRVQPSRLQGNVVIPRRFRLSDSVESRTRTISVDTFSPAGAWTCRFDAQQQAHQMMRRHIA
jgi:hypothetical protein